MTKQELQINDKKIVIMAQPVKFVLGLERKYSDRQLVGYCEEILKYPAGINLSLTEIINIPHTLSSNGLVLDTVKDGKVDLYLIEKLFFSLKEDKTNPAYVGELFVKLCNEKVEKFKYKELVEIGTEIFTQIGEFAFLVQIRESFRNM